MHMCCYNFFLDFFPVSQAASMDYPASKDFFHAKFARISYWLLVYLLKFWNPQADFTLPKLFCFSSWEDKEYYELRVARKCVIATLSFYLCFANRTSIFFLVADIIKTLVNILYGYLYRGDIPGLRLYCLKESLTDTIWNWNSVGQILIELLNEIWKINPHATMKFHNSNISDTAIDFGYEFVIASQEFCHNEVPVPM